MAGHHDPRLLYSINGITAYHIQNGEESTLNPSGPQTMSLLMVPTAHPFTDLSSTTGPENEIPEEDFYLHLHLPPELDLPLPATTQVYHKPPRSYLIPRWDLGPDAGAFTRIEFPEKINREDVDTFETILAQCTAFLERALPPTGDMTHKPYDPREWASGGKMGGGKTQAGQIVLVDEENGSIVGELAEGAHIVEDSKLDHGTKDPVEIHLSQDGSRIDVRPVSEDYLELANHPAYRDSSIVQNAASASRLLVTGSSHIGKMLQNRADSFTQTTKPNPEPMQFGPSTRNSVRKLNSFSQQGAALSAKTLGMVSKHAQNLGAMLARKNEERAREGFGKDGKPLTSYKPGLLNKSMIAFTTIADGLAQSGKSLVATGGAAATTVVNHRYGAEAGEIAGNLAGGVKNVSLVYVDVTGVTRKAVIKSVARGMVVGKVRGGGEVVVGGGDGGSIPQQDIEKATHDNLGRPSGKVKAGKAGGAPPPYQSNLGEQMSNLSMKGKNTQI